MEEEKIESPPQEEKTEAVKVDVAPKKEIPNSKKERHAGGRPPLWTSPEVVQKMIDEYLKREKMPTMAGLAVSLDVSRATLYNYAEKDDFLDTIKRGRERIEEIYEQLLLYGDKPTGVIFALKNTGWSDNAKIDHSTLGKSLNIGLVSYLPNEEDQADEN